MSEQGFKSKQTPESGASQFNAITFLVKQLLSRVNTATLVQVVACTNSGGVTPVGTVDVQPLVDQQDGYGNAVPFAKLYKLPYFRLQGGANAFILDPAVGDIGVAVFASRDTSVVRSTKKQASPGSGRQFSLSDGLYFGGMLNGTPTNYIQFNGNDVNVKATGNVNVTSPHVTLADGGTALALMNENLVAWLNSHTHEYSPGAGTPTPSAAPGTTVPTNAKTTVTKAE